MAVFALKLLLAPSLVALASLATRRFGPALGGLLVGLPVVAGPVLLVLALEHGSRFGADAARASVLGLIGLALFAVVYGRSCATRSWRLSLPLGWVAFLAAAAALDGVSAATVPSVALAGASFLLALAALPAPARPGDPARLPWWDLPARAAAAAALVVALSAASGTLGAHLSGLLAPFPVAASVLAAFTHAHGGADDVLRLLRGLLLGLFAFALFCATAAVALPRVGVAAAFGLAAALALAVQAGVLVLGGASAPAARSSRS